MPFRHGKATGVYLAGLNFSPFFNSADIARTVDTHDVTAFEQDAKSYIAGMADGTISLSGFYDANGVAGEGAEENLQTLRDNETEFPATIFQDGGVVVGRACRMANVYNTTYTVTSPATDVVSAKADLTVDGGVKFGKCLNDKQTITGSVITGTAGDYGTTDFLSSVGGWAHIHPIANTRSTSITVKTQHSADNSVWVDTSTTVIGAGSRTGVRVPTTLTNLRYVRALITPTAGTGSAVIIVAFARA